MDDRRVKQLSRIRGARRRLIADAIHLQFPLEREQARFDFNFNSNDQRQRQEHSQQFQQQQQPRTPEYLSRPLQIDPENSANRSFVSSRTPRNDETRKVLFNIANDNNAQAIDYDFDYDNDYDDDDGTGGVDNSGLDDGGLDNEYPNVDEDRNRDSNRRTRDELYGYDDGDSDDNDDFDDGDEPMDVDMGQSDVTISRLPTSTSRLTSIDIVIQKLTKLSSLEESKHRKVFYKLTINYLNKILDLNLVNNDYIHDLKSLQSIKKSKRRELFHKRQEINENLIELENLRKNHSKLIKILNLKRQIEFKIENLRNTNQTVSTSILFKVEKLNKIIGPNYGVVDIIQKSNQILTNLHKITTS